MFKVIEDKKVRAMLMEMSELLEKVYRDKLKAVILYGSMARGTATEESDVDVMILVDGTEQEMRKFEDSLNDISTDISLKYYKVLSIIDVSYQEYDKWKTVSPFYKNVSQEGVILYAA